MWPSLGCNQRFWRYATSRWTIKHCHVQCTPLISQMNRKCKNVLLSTSISTGLIFTVRKQDASNMSFSWLSHQLAPHSSPMLVWLNLSPKFWRFRRFLNGFQAEFQQVVHTCTHKTGLMEPRQPGEIMFQGRDVYSVCTAVITSWIYWFSFGSPSDRVCKPGVHFLRPGTAAFKAASAEILTDCCLLKNGIFQDEIVWSTNNLKV